MSKEIKEQIDKLNAEIESLGFDPTFVLNSRIAATMCKISQLQNQCQHSFVNGACEFCYIEQEGN